MAETVGLERIWHSRVEAIEALPTSLPERQLEHIWHSALETIEVLYTSLVERQLLPLQGAA